ncbi:Hypothetical_protein [Hexamita inflata]|uniref:Hypothetical_protein n=1 Tax=Hexamita inflata TaxID=28002 RepID=A0AA86NFM2_9EUKA|nr:Hypothetical protein HINF_LOCUS6325 [Hexamita inflata]
MNIQNMIRLHPSIDVYLQFCEGEFKLYSKYQGKVMYSFMPTKVKITNVQSYQLYQGKLYVQASDLYVLQDFDLELVVQLPPNSQFFTFCKQMYVISYKTVYQILDNQLVHVMDFEHNTEVFQFGTFVFFKQNEIFYSCQTKNNEFTMNYNHGIKVEGDLVFHGSGLCLFNKDNVYNCFNLMTGQSRQKQFKEIIYTAGCCGTQIRNNIANKLFEFKYALDVQNIFNSHFEANGTQDYMRQLLKMCNKCEFRIKDQEIIDWETENLRENTIPFQKLKYCFKIENQNRSLVFVDQDLYVIDENRNILKRIFLNLDIKSNDYQPALCNGKIYIQYGNDLLVLEQDKLVFICEMPSNELGLFTHFNNLFYLSNYKIYILNNNKFKLYIQSFYNQIMQLSNQIRIQTSHLILSVTENFSETKIIHYVKSKYFYNQILYNKLILVYYDKISYSQNIQIVDLLSNFTHSYKTKEFTEQHVKYQKEFNNFGVRLKQQLCAKYNIQQQEDMLEVTNCNDICNNSVMQLDVQINTENILYSNPQSSLQFYQYINILPVIKANLYAVIEDGFLLYADFNNTILHRIPVDFSGCFINSSNKQFDFHKNISQQQIVISKGNIYIFNYEKLYLLQFSDNKLNVQFVTDIPLKEHYKDLKYYYFSFEDSLYVILKNDIYVLMDNQFILHQTLAIQQSINYIHELYSNAKTSKLQHNYQAIQFCNNVYIIYQTNIYILKTKINKQFKLQKLYYQQYPLSIITVCGGLAIFESQYKRLYLNMIISEIKELHRNDLEYLRKNNSYEIKPMGLQFKSQILNQFIDDSFENNIFDHYQAYISEIMNNHFAFRIFQKQLYSKQYNFNQINRLYNIIEQKIHSQQQTIMLALNSALERQAYYSQIFDQICFNNESQ